MLSLSVIFLEARIRHSEDVPRKQIFFKVSPNSLSMFLGLLHEAFFISVFIGLDTKDGFLKHRISKHSCDKISTVKSETNKQNYSQS